MIEVSNLTKNYGSHCAIKDVSFAIDSGEVVGFLGPNGAGKTTTMRILTGFMAASSGAATVAGFDVHSRPMDVKRHVGYLPESVPLYREMVVRSYLSYVGEIKGLSRRARRVEIDRVLERCGLSEMANRLIGNLSKGYRQRVGLAQALIGDPPVLILDEPTVGLDPKQIVGIRKMIGDLARDHTVLLSTHILPEVAMICQRVIIIHHGEIVARFNMDELEGAASTRLEVELVGDEEVALQTLRGIAGVEDARKVGENRYVVDSTGSDEIVQVVASSLVAKGLALRSLERHKRTLEDAFIEAISSEKEHSE